MNIDNNDIPLLFKGLSDLHRIKILEILLLGEECNCNLSEKMGMPLSTLAHHLKVLTSANLVLSRRDGKWTYYEINREQFNNAICIIDKFTKAHY